MALGIPQLAMPQLDWEHVWGMPPVEPDPRVEAEMAERRAETTRTIIDSKRNRFRNLAMLIVALSGILATTGLIRQGQEQQQKAQAVSSDTNH